MENTKNTHQNPDQDAITDQEENSSPVTITENRSESEPTEETQIEETAIIEEFHESPEPSGDIVSLSSEDDISEAEARESEENFDQYSREQLIGILETVVGETDINSIKTRIALIKVAYLKKKKEENLQRFEKIKPEEDHDEIPLKEPAEDPLDARYEELFNIYKAARARFIDEQEKLKQDNLKKKIKILEDLKLLIGSEETLKKTYDEFRTLQDKWKEIGMVPRSEINNLWQNYHFLVEKFFDKVKLNKELKDLDLRKNMEAKIALCERTEELLLETSIIKSFRQLQKYHDEWKEIGPVPTDKKDELWERFKNATDKINERRREYYTRIEEEQKKNLETKTALCEKAEELLELRNENLKTWQETTHQMNDLLTLWKSIGPVPQKFNNEIWTRFKSSLDAFFVNKKEFFDKLKEHQVNNYNLKLDLCVQAEALRSSTDWKKTTQEMIQLQQEWKNIGPVPRKHSDKIWKRFRVACDEFFSAKSSFFSNIHQHEEENLNRKVELMNKLKEHEFGEDKNKNLEALKNFQREWTDIGHIPIRDKDRLQNEFRTLINQHLDKLKISEVEISAITFQTRVEALKNDPNSRRLMSRERENLSMKIGKLREDINLWENNIGFLAVSKNAAILKEEFEKKINKAKTELKVMEAKLKMLRS